MYKLRPGVQPYPWGSRTALTEVLDIAPTGGPMAELWMGAHPALPTPVNGDTLADIIERDPVAALGPEVVSTFGPRLPLLLKVLAIDAPLSIQAHPSNVQAEAGFEREERLGIAIDSPTRTYRDRSHKPELICALTEVEALCGFREFDDTRRLLRQLAVPVATRLAAAIDGGAGQVELLRSCLVGTFFSENASGDTAGLGAAARREATRVGSDRLEQRNLRAIADIAERHPGDGGVLVALLLRYRLLAPGDALFLAAGNVHAYLRGVGVEVMANSDNVLRGGLTPKHIDIDELCAIVVPSKVPPPVLAAEQIDSGLRRWPSEVADFVLHRIDVEPLRTGVSSNAVTLPAGPNIVLCVAGNVALETAADRVELRRGESAFVAANESARAAGAGQAFVASVNVSARSLS